jgi:hypothetical protein
VYRDGEAVSDDPTSPTINPAPNADPEHPRRLPVRVRDGLVRTFRTWRALRATGDVRRVDDVAAWRPDEGVGGRPGTRSAHAHGKRRLVCSADDLDLVLDVVPGKLSGCVDVIGQVLPRTGGPVPSGDVELWHGHVNVFQTDMSDAGEFNYRNIPEGDYSLYVAWPERGILVAPAALRLSPTA